MTSRKPARIVNAAAARGWWTDPPNRRFLAALLSPLTKSSTRAAVGTVAIPPHGEGGLHAHPRRTEEIWYVIEGRGLVQLGGSKFRIRAGDAISGPGGVPHQLINTGRSWLRALWVLCPAGGERKIVEMTKVKGRRFKK